MLSFEYNGVGSTQALPAVINHIKYPLWHRAVSNINQLHSDLHSESSGCGI